MSDQPHDSTHGLLDVSDYEIKTVRCPDCKQHYARVTGYVSRGQETLAAYYAVCHGHPDHEVALDMMFGTWGSGDMSDHETFSCRVRPDGAMVVDPFVTLSVEPSRTTCPTSSGAPSLAKRPSITRCSASCGRSWTLWL